MISKILCIKNYARFDKITSKDIHSKNMSNGKLKKINLFYAPNGSGKTSLSLIFQSLASKKASLINKKQSLLTDESTKIQLDLEGKIETFSNHNWEDTSIKHPDIKVFNSYYLNNNVYSFNLNDDVFSIYDFILKENKSKFKSLEKSERDINSKINSLSKKKRKFGMIYIRKMKIENQLIL